MDLEDLEDLEDFLEDFLEDYKRVFTLFYNHIIILYSLQKQSLYKIYEH